MKKIILLLSFSFCFLFSYGQNTKPERSEHKVKFGIEAGLNFPKIIFLYPRVPQINALNNPEIYLFALAWHAGIYSTIRFSDKFDFRPELEYAVKGYRYNSGRANGRPDSYSTIRINYIEIPLQIQYKMGQHFSVLAGPYIGILTSLTSTVDPNNFNYGTKGDNKLDFGGVIGVGYKISNGFNFNIKCSQGFTHLGPKYFNGHRQYSSSNLVLSICFGWTIGKWHQ